MAKLILRGEDGADQEFPLEQSGSLTVGRSPECEITISDSQASRRHCSVVRIQSGWELADLGSTNGTLLNSVLVKRKKLKHGDVIRIGSTEIMLHDPGAAGGGEELGNCHLVYAKGDRKGEKVELSEQRTTIGRKESNTLVLADGNASSYHAEVVRGLNGYTIRDLGSTNGTLVNSEMITEAPLVHGARIRIGSTRFVFQDPAMAEIDLELAGVDDDEADWGMMRELDLAAVRRRNPAVIAYGVVFLAILGGLWYVTTLGPKQGEAGPVPPSNSLIETYSFETAASAFLWESDQPGLVVARTTREVKGEGTAALEMRCNADRADVLYADRFNASGRRYRLEGKLGARGATARLGLLWRGLGLSRWDVGEPVSAMSLESVKLSSGAPPWASEVVAGVRIEGQGSAFLDDVSLVDTGSNAAVEVEQNNFTITVVDGTDVDISHSGAPILVHGRLVAGGSSISARALDAEHVLLTIEGDGARLGVEFQEERGYLSRGGYRGFGYTEAGGTYFTRSFPSEGSRRDDRVRKLLVGNPGRAFAVLPSTDGARVSSEARVEGKRRFWTISGAPADGKFSFRIKTDLRGETAIAKQRMSHALSLHRKGKWGEFKVEAERALAEFPFAPKSTQRKLNDRIGEVTKAYNALVKEAAAMIADYREFRDRQSLDRVLEILEVLRAKFQVEPGEGSRGEQYASLAGAEASMRTVAERERQSRMANSVLEQALYIHIPEGEVYSAAVMLTYITEWLPASKQAEEARTELAKIEREQPQVLGVLKSLGLRR